MVVLRYKRPWIYPKQREAIFNDVRYAVIEASTKSGKTLGCILWLIEKALLGRAGQNFWWVAPVSGQARIAFNRVRRGLPDRVASINKSRMEITLANGAVIMFKSADKPDSLYGEDVYAAVMDEASRCKEEAWIALRSTLTATRGPVRIIGNVKGRKNWAYRMARQAQAGAPNMAFFKITAWDAVAAGILEREEIEDAELVLPADVFRQLYLAEPADDEGNPFGIEAIRACIQEISLPDLPLDDERRRPPAWYGWDLAKSYDWTVGIGLAQPVDGVRDTVRFQRFQQPWGSTILRIRSETLAVPGFIDATGVGDPIVEELIAGGGINLEGYKYTSESKQQLMEALAVSIQQRKISFPLGPIVDELEEFEYTFTRAGGVKYSAPEGLHDDCVNALAMANLAAERTSLLNIRFF